MVFEFGLIFVLFIHTLFNIESLCFYIASMKDMKQVYGKSMLIETVKRHEEILTTQTNVEEVSLRAFNM